MKQQEQAFCPHMPGSINPIQVNDLHEGSSIEDCREVLGKEQAVINYSDNIAILLDLLYAFFSIH